MGKVFTAVCLFVFPDNISKPDAARITELDIQMFHDEPWKPIYFGIKRSKVKVTAYVSVFTPNTLLSLLRT